MQSNSDAGDIRGLPARRWGFALAFGFYRPVLFVLTGLAATIYIAFQKKALPDPIARLVARVSFYPTMPFTALKSMGNYWTQIDDTIIVGCAPFHIFGHVKELYRVGVRGVVNLCDEYKGPVPAYDSLQMRQLWLRTIDHTEPTLCNLQIAVKFIQQYHDKGEKVYIHCKAGHGRSAAVALCWLMKQNPKLSAKDLNEQMLKVRYVRKRLYSQPNVQAYELSLAGAPSEK